MNTLMSLLAELSLDERSHPFQVLIVDDDIAIQTLMKTLLERRGVIVQCATDGEEALAFLDEHVYDAIVLDLMLPRKNGFDVIGDLKERSPHLLNRVVVVTAVSEQTLRLFDCTAVRSMLRKPFDIDVFIREVFACGNRLPAEPAGRASAPDAGQRARSM